MNTSTKTTIVNPNRPFSVEQITQLEAHYGGKINEVAYGANFPSSLPPYGKPAEGLGNIANFALEHIEKYPSFDAWMPNGMGLGAAALVASFAGSHNMVMPKAALFASPAQQFAFLGEADLSAIRTQVRATRFDDAETKPLTGKVLLLSASHGVTPAFIAKVAELENVNVEDVEVRSVDSHYEFESLEQLVNDVIGQINQFALTQSDWETSRIVAYLPAHASAAMVMLVSLHARMGHFPAALRVEMDFKALISEDKGFYATEIVDLEAIQMEAGMRARAKADEARVRAQRVAMNLAFSRMPEGSVLLGNVIRVPVGDSFVELNVASATVS